MADPSLIELKIRSSCSTYSDVSKGKEALDNDLDTSAIESFSASYDKVTLLNLDCKSWVGSDSPRATDFDTSTTDSTLLFREFNEKEPGNGFESEFCGWNGFPLSTDFEASRTDETNCPFNPSNIVETATVETGLRMLSSFPFKS